MLKWTLLSVCTLAALGQVPAVDCRVSNPPGTKTSFTIPQYRTRVEWEAHKARLRRQILFAAGLSPMLERTPLNAKIFGRVERNDFSVEKVYMETMPGFYLGGNLYRPLGKKGKFPGVLCPHGHWLYGRLEHQTVISAPTRAINFAKQGYVVFAYDMVGYNDTFQTPHKFEEPAQQLWSFGPFALQLWDSIRALDFLESLPEVDKERIAVTGESGGGTQTFMLAAVDDRVKYDAPVNMVSASFQGGCFCENAPGLRYDTSNLEIAAMMAPRPMLLVFATGDFTSNSPKEAFPGIRRIYELYGKADNVEMVQIDAPHNYNKESREAVYRFFGERVLRMPDAASIMEKSGPMAPLPDLLVFYGRALPENALSFERIFAQWKNNCRRQMETIHDPERLREGVMWALGAEWPPNVLNKGEDKHTVLSREGRRDRVSSLLTEGSGVPLLLVHPDGAEAARELTSGQKRPVMTIDAFSAKRDQSEQHFLTFNRTDDANRVQDILTALAFLHSRYQGRIELQGIGKAGIWCLFAAAVAPVDLKLSVDLKGFAGTDEEFLKQFFVPGIQRAGGLQAALTLTSRLRSDR